MWTSKQLRILLVVGLLTASTIAVVLVPMARPASGLLPFASYSDLSGFLDSARAASRTTGTGATPTAGPSLPASSPTAGPSGPAYSGTNVQVAGVDELDMVKTDGTYVYVASQGEVAVLLAYPATEMSVVSRISLGNLTAAVTGSNATYAVGEFLDGTNLLVVANSFPGWPGIYSGGGPVALAPATSFAAPTLVPWTPQTFAFLFDVSDPSRPVLDHTIMVDGTVSTGRMVGSVAYLVATEWILEVNGTYSLPQVCVDGTCSTLDPSQIYHDPQSTDAWDYTDLLSLDLGTGDARMISIVTGGWSTLYMSPTSMYLAFQKWVVTAVPMMAGALMPVLLGNGYTTIYKLAADGLEITPGSSATVPGSLRSQYSMDEWNGDLRVATTVRTYSNSTVTIRNDIYVFDAAMALVGAVVGLAPGESIFAVRFLGDRAYVVTFRMIDPLFVIDLSNPANPTVSGYLKMPGFSEYLYPLDAGHLLGVGKDAVPAVEGNWSWYQGLQLSLYDVTNSSAPTETANVSIGDRGTQSEVLNDPHAFLYVPDRQLVVLPVDLAIINASLYPDGVPPYAWGSIVWQGAYVYKVNQTTGFQFVGRVAHGNGTTDTTYMWYGSPTEIRRSLYIGDVLYTVSATEVLASSLSDLSTISSVVYATPPVWPYGGPVPMM